MIKIIKREKLPLFLAELLKDYEVIAPVKEDGRIVFRAVESPQDVRLDLPNAMLSPKEFFFPPSEQIFEFEKESVSGGNVSPDRKRAIFGIRPCDVNALSIMDEIFMGKNEDSEYAKRRKNTLLISINCINPGDHCFCLGLGTGPFASNADLAMTELDGKYLIEAKGSYQNMLNSDLFGDPSPKDKEEKGRRETEAEVKMKKVINPAEISKRLENVFDSPCWNETAKRCLSCGICTYLCPTCHCFDVFDEYSSSERGERTMCWDSCMFPAFTKLAGGENPRATKSERLRQRIYHKFKYFPDRCGKPACVGCGRCIDACPAGLNILSVVEKCTNIRR